MDAIECHEDQIVFSLVNEQRGIKGSIHLCPVEKKEEAFIYQLFVHKEYRQQRIASVLVNEAIRYARARGLSVVVAPEPWGDSTMDVVALREWYFRLGFDPIADDEYGCMVLPINKSLDAVE